LELFQQCGILELFGLVFFVVHLINSQVIISTSICCS
jgi:hypothetical protein